MKWNRYFFFLLLGALFSAAFSPWAHASKGHDGAQSGDMDAFFEGASKEKGFNVYMLGRALEGEKIKTKGGPDWLQGQGGGCVTCHGGEGKGGILPPECDKETPSIRLGTLLSSEHEHGGIKEKHTPDTIETIRRGLESSVGPDNRPYAPCMPKWFLEDDDFRDRLHYLNSLSGQ